MIQVRKQNCVVVAHKVLLGACILHMIAMGMSKQIFCQFISSTVTKSEVECLELKFG